MAIPAALPANLCRRRTTITTSLSSKPLAALLLLLVAALAAASFVDVAAAARPAGAGPPVCSPVCVNGAKCVKKACKCHPGSTGTTCETIQPGYVFDGKKPKPCLPDLWCTGGPVPGAGAVANACPANTKTDGAKKTSLGDCRLKAGYFCVFNASGVCTVTECQPGFYCPGNTSITDITKTGLVPCPACATPGCTPSSPVGASEVTQCSCVCPPPASPAP